MRVFTFRCLVALLSGSVLHQRQSTSHLLQAGPPLSAQLGHQPVLHTKPNVRTVQGPKATRSQPSPRHQAREHPQKGPKPPLGQMAPLKMDRSPPAPKDLSSDRSHVRKCFYVAAANVLGMSACSFRWKRSNLLCLGRITEIKMTIMKEQKLHTKRNQIRKSSTEEYFLIKDIQHQKRLRYVNTYFILSFQLTHERKQIFTEEHIIYRWAHHAYLF